MYNTRYGIQGIPEEFTKLQSENNILKNENDILKNENKRLNNEIEVFKEAFKKMEDLELRKRVANFILGSD